MSTGEGEQDKNLVSPSWPRIVLLDVEKSGGNHMFFVKLLMNHGVSYTYVRELPKNLKIGEFYMEYAYGHILIDRVSHDLGHWFSETIYVHPVPVRFPKLCCGLQFGADAPNPMDYEIPFSEIFKTRGGAYIPRAECVREVKAEEMTREIMMSRD